MRKKWPAKKLQGDGHIMQFGFEPMNTDNFKQGSDIARFVFQKG